MAKITWREIAREFLEHGERSEQRFSELVSSEHAKRTEKLLETITTLERDLAAQKEATTNLVTLVFDQAVTLGEILPALSAACSRGCDYCGDSLKWPRAVAAKHNS